MIGADMQMREATKRDREDVIGVLTLAFHRDPVSNHIFRHEGSRPQQHQKFFGVFVDAVLDAGDAGRIDVLTTPAGVVVAAALWLDVPANTPEDHSIADLMHDVIEPEAAGRFAVLDAFMGEVHPTDPHLYLMFAGVDPTYQRKGLGARLIANGIRQWESYDKTRREVYLEASSAENAALYERLGFRYCEEEIPAGPNALLRPMWLSRGALAG